MTTNTDIKEYDNFSQVDPKNDLKFKINKRYAIWKRDTSACTFIEKAFGISLLGVYSEEDSIPPTETELNLGCIGMVLYFESGRITQLTNSEWGASIEFEELNNH